MTPNAWAASGETPTAGISEAASNRTVPAIQTEVVKPIGKTSMDSIQKDSLDPSYDKTLSSETSEPAAGEKENEKIPAESGETKPAFQFSSILADQGEMKLSGHESLFFQPNSLSAKSFGNTVTLNLEDQKVFSVTYVGYVLGPFAPDYDYLGVYFQTLEDLQKLVGRLTQKTKETDVDGHLTTAFQEAQNTLQQVIEHGHQKLEDQANQAIYQDLTLALVKYYEGKMPEYQSLTFSERKDKDGAVLWEAVMVLNDRRETGMVQNRLIVLEPRDEAFVVREVLDRDYAQHVCIRDAYAYETPEQIKKHEMETYFTSGKLKVQSKEQFLDGVRNQRNYIQFSETGEKIRHLTETFYAEGSLKSSSDYRYHAGKKYSVRYDRDGKAIQTHSELIPSQSVL